MPGDAKPAPGRAKSVADATGWIAVDWGTSNLRLWGMSPDDRPTFEAHDERGMSRLTQADYPRVLGELIPGTAPREVLVCGMAGARQGWVEAPYLELPAELGELGAAAVPAPADAGFRVRILPGVCRREPGHEDVMRGEETQLLGLARLRPGFAGMVCMPGTHAKWAQLDGTRLTGFSTAMTGELFEAVSAHTVLRHSLGGEGMGPATEDGIDDGLTAGLARPERLTSALFRTRAAALLADKGPDWCTGYLSGLLVGAEVAGYRAEIAGGPVPIIGSARLSRLYAAALQRLGIATEPIDATEATLAGLAAAHRQPTPS